MSFFLSFFLSVFLSVTHFLKNARFTQDNQGEPRGESRGVKGNQRESIRGKNSLE